MVSIATPSSDKPTKFLLLGSGEIGKEIAIEAQRMGVHVVAVDRYENAPAMQVAHKSYTVSMLDEGALRHIIKLEQPDFIVPEIEAIATSLLVELEAEGFHVVPSAKAVRLTMDRAGIRRLAAEELGLQTSPYRFAKTYEDYLAAIKTIGLPCVVKPIMSSSGKGQSIVRNKDGIESAFHLAKHAARGDANELIVESFISFDYEITLLSVRHVNGTTFCAPIGHTQQNGDYRESWQPHPMAEVVRKKAEAMAECVTQALGGYGVFGVEFFVEGEEVYFNEVSPRPHDTGLVTLVSQDLSEFALHVRAILGLPIPAIRQLGPAASSALLVSGYGKQIRYHNLESALSEVDTHLRLFGKPEVNGERRMGVVLSAADDLHLARAKAGRALSAIRVDVQDG